MKSNMKLKVLVACLFFVLGTLSGFGQIEFSLDDNPSVPFTGPFMPPYGSAEDEFGILGLSLGGSPSLVAFGFFDSDVLVAGPGLSMTFPPVPYYVDAYSSNHIFLGAPPPPMAVPGATMAVFSVDRISMGIPAGTGAADIFTTAFGGANALWIPGAAFGLVALPNIPAFAAADNIDGYNEFLTPMAATGTYFALHPASSIPMGLSPAAIYFSPPGALMWPVPVYAPPAAMGLMPGDSIDALVVWDTATMGVMDPGFDVALYSLAPGSPTLAALGLDGGTIFWTTFAGGSGIYAPTAALGLIPGVDNVDALDHM